jgi:hypothetical protein
MVYFLKNGSIQVDDLRAAGSRASNLFNNGLDIRVGEVIGQSRSAHEDVQQLVIRQIHQ